MASSVANLHGVDEHPSQTEGNFLWKFLSCHGHLETVAEINVQDFTAQSIQHQVGRMPIPQAQNVADH